MAEAEDVIVDAARHATIFAHDLWRRHRRDPHAPTVVHLAQVAERLELLVEAVFGMRYPLRIAQVPARNTLLMRLFHRHELPPVLQALPATDGSSLWLPADLHNTDFCASLQRFRVLALRLAMRAQRRSAAVAAKAQSVLEQGIYSVLEAHAADAALSQLLPGVAAALELLRRDALALRPRMESMPARYRPLERLLRSILRGDHGAASGHPLEGMMHGGTAEQTLALARKLVPRMAAPNIGTSEWGNAAIFKDHWTGDYLPAPVADRPQAAAQGSDDMHDDIRARSARLLRRPQVRRAAADEDDKDPGVWMIQTAAPMEHAEDPMGMQRPADRDSETAAEEFADSLSELAQARLMSTPQRSREILLSDDPPAGRATLCPAAAQATPASVQYPEWDYRIKAYHDPGATVHMRVAPLGPVQWVDETLERHQALLPLIRRQFEMLRPERMLHRKQREGENIDLDAYIGALSEKRAGLSMSGALYENRRPGKRDAAIMLLMDISGSTDSWLSADQRIIDVEKEALLLVCAALESIGDAYAVQAFSGEGSRGVTVSTLKSYHERYDERTARRIAALEPDRYTRTGAALRHAAATLMKEPAKYRLLLLLSDGKPNDADQYEGRYGVEDMCQAVMEARLQGIFPFCLTIDRRAAGYLADVFGSHYALLPKSEHLPAVLLDWLRRLLTR